MIVNRHRQIIRTYSQRLHSLLQGSATTIEHGYLYGQKISARDLVRSDHRYWSKKELGVAVPEINVLLLIDGSGSMMGSRAEAAKDTAIILHEVFKNNQLRHAVVDYRAEPSMFINENDYLEDDLDWQAEINILIDFDARPEQESNLLKINGDGGTPSAETLLWSLKYLRVENDQQTFILMITDGLVDPDDLAAVVRYANRHGVTVIGIAIDQPGSDQIYQIVHGIFPHTIQVTDLQKMPQQILKLINQLLQ
ncbi:MAG: VWA domain-containing protein [Lactobacillaceae bacterium]|jgi:uncharacterized protein with von Willebrand factor type A (vWA) domain|nr:VWA domain-containing protein [Lactobacillaceae bacterium]